MLRLIVTWLLNALALLVLPYVVHSIRVTSVSSALFAALVLAFINTLIRPLLVLLTLPVTLLTLGLFIFVINALMLLLVSAIPFLGFVVNGFFVALIASIVISAVSWALSMVLPD